MRVRTLWPLVKEAVASWVDDYAPSMGAALAYYTLFSVAPLLLIVISVAGLAFGNDAARVGIFTEIEGLMGTDGAAAIEALLESVNRPKTGVAATIVGVVALLIGATTVFGELQNALDRIWRAPALARPTGWWSLLRARLLSFGMIMGIGFLLMASLVASAALSALGKWWSPLFGGWEVLLQAVNFVVGFAIITLAFAMIYKIMPRVRIQWRDVWVGAAVTALLFSVGKLLIGLYIGKSSVTSGFGAAGSLVVVLIWVYWAAQIFLMGAEFTWVYAHRYGSLRHEPKPPSRRGVPPEAVDRARAAGAAQPETAASAMPPAA